MQVEYTSSNLKVVGSILGECTTTVLLEKNAMFIRMYLLKCSYKSALQDYKADYQCFWC